MSRKLLAIAALSLATSTFAQDFGYTKNALYGGFGFTEGGFSLGVDYEYTGHRDFGFGGYARIYPKDDSGTLRKEGVTTFGAFVRPHFNKKAWDFYVSPGLAIISISSIYSSNPGDATTLGPSLALGLLYEINSNVALGIENMRTWVWFDNDWRGLRIDDLMFKFRVAF